MDRTKPVDKLEDATHLVDIKTKNIYEIIVKSAELCLGNGEEVGQIGIVIKCLVSKDVKVIKYESLSDFTFEAKFSRDDEIDEMLSNYYNLIDDPELNKAELIEISNAILDEIHVDAGDRTEHSLIAMNYVDGLEECIENIVSELVFHYSSHDYEILSTPYKFIIEIDGKDFIVDNVFYWKKN